MEDAIEGCFFSGSGFHLLPSCSTATEKGFSMHHAIHPERIRRIGGKDANRKGKCIVYLMQQSQRAADNPALDFAREKAAFHNQPLFVVFGLFDGFPEANLRHFTFMVEGLTETAATLNRMGIPFLVWKAEPDALGIAVSQAASFLVLDRGYLGIQKKWESRISGNAFCPVFQVEGDVVFPVEMVSAKREYGAYTLRPKWKKCRHFYEEERTFSGTKQKLPEAGDDLGAFLAQFFSPVDISSCETALGSLSPEKGVQPVTRFFKGGTSRACALFRDFLDNRISSYAENAGHPGANTVSCMSPYLHFGQVSPRFLMQKVLERIPDEDGFWNGKSRDFAAESPLQDAGERYLEQLLIRRELSMNFVHYTKDYDSPDCLPDWARKSLFLHKADTREHIYPADTLEQAGTHDPYWNAAMEEMRITGYMHNHMRMYWGKKILEWSDTPEKAYETIRYLNNRYFLDGRDPNSYAGIGWIFGLHDRPWKERPVFGKIRYMNAKGLERKTDIQGYVDRVNHLKNQ